MKKLSVRVERKKEMGQLYEKGLSGISGVELIHTNYEDCSPWFYDILCERRSELQEFLKSKNIGSRIFYPPLHSEPAYGYTNLHFPVTEEISAKGLWLPSTVTLTDNQIEYICNCVCEFYK